MAKRMNKTTAQALLKLINEHLASGRFLPEEVLRSTSLILGLYNFLEYRMDELDNKVTKALNPAPGQKLGPEEVKSQIHEAFSQVKISLRFSAQLLVEQKAQMHKLEAEKAVQRVHGVQKARKPKTKRRPR